MVLFDLVLGYKSPLYASVCVVLRRTINGYHNLLINMAYIVRTLIYRYYKNYLCSVTGLFFVVLYLFALIFPFLFAVSTGGNLEL